MTNDIKVTRRCADREGRTLMLAVIEAPAIVYITFEKSFDISNKQLRGATASLTRSLTHLSNHLVEDEKSWK